MPTRSAFGDFVIEPQRRRLLRRGEVVPLGERSFATLLALLERPGEVVTKAELLDEVWPDAVVGDDSVAKAVSDLRVALGDPPAAPRYVQTVPRRGYRFIGELVDLSKPKPTPPSGNARSLVVLGSTLAVGESGSGEKVVVPGAACPRWSPDSRWIAYLTAPPDGAPGELWIVRPNGLDNRRLTGGEITCSELCWTPDSAWLIVGGAAGGRHVLYAVSVPSGDLHRITPDPDPRPAAYGSTD